MRFDVSVLEAKVTVSLALLGRHNITNALAAIACGLESGMTLEACAKSRRYVAAGQQARRNS